MRTPTILLVALLAIAPLAAAEWYEGKPDCPPDQFCTESHAGAGDDAGEGPTFGDCGGEVCALGGDAQNAAGADDPARASPVPLLLVFLAAAAAMAVAGARNL